MRRPRRRGRFETNPIDRIMTVWDSNPAIKRPLGLRRVARDPQKVDARAEAKLGAPMISPVHIRVSVGEYGLISWMKKGMNTSTKLKEKAIPNWEREMKRTFL
jgi:hypothetical protein